MTKAPSSEVIFDELPQALDGSACASDDAFAGNATWALQQLIDSPRLFEGFPYGLALVDRSGGVLYLNRKARELLVPESRPSTAAPWTCCDLICSRLGGAVGDVCLAEQAARPGKPMPEVRMEVRRGSVPRSAWVTASQIDSQGELLFHLRPGKPGDRRRRASLDWPHSPDRQPALRIVTLGRFRVETPEGPIGGEWLRQRPGQLLKYVIAERHGMVANDRIAEALWPDAGPSEARGRLRYYVHTLRDKIEPDRVRRSPACFLVAHRGGYALDASRVWIDADEFEREARAGLAAFAQGSVGPASGHLRNALRLYRGRFLVDDLYEDWALDERERLHELAGRALRVEVEIQMQQGRLDAASDHARRLAEMEPFDTDVQKLFIEICLKRGRRSEALRRYSVLRKRMLVSFGQGPDFDLAALEREVG